jgi:uncharacterized protein
LRKEIHVFVIFRMACPVVVDDACSFCAVSATYGVSPRSTGRLPVAAVSMHGNELRWRAPANRDTLPGVMRMLFLAAVLLVALPAQARADWDRGLAAYGAGDYARALTEWAPAAGQGDVRAQEMLGYMYDVGEGVPEDDRSAAAWYGLAADRGSAAAQLNLAMLYASGSGVPEDYVRAFMWLEVAARTGEPALHDLAVKARSALAARMSEREIDEARKLARAWAPR